MPLQTGFCQVCGVPFEAQRADRRFCGAPCRLKAHARRRLGELRPLVTALENARLHLLAEVGRWEKVEAGGGK